MHSSSSEITEENQFCENNSLDSGFLEDAKTSPGENKQCCFKVKKVGAKNNLDKNLQLPSSSRERKSKKRKLEEDEPERSGAFTTQEYVKKMKILQELREKEKQLKIAIAYEQLRKEQPIYLSTDLLHEKIVESQRLLQEARSEHKMKNVMCVNLQLANTLQRIVGKPKTAHKPNRFSDSQRKCIKGLLKTKNELTRRISVKRKEIAEIDEDILKLEKTVSANQQIVNKPMADSGSSYANTETDNLEELQRLKENNEKVAKRIHLLSGIIQCLVPHAGSRWRDEPELADLMAECEKVSECRFDDLEEMDGLLRSVCSVNL